MTLGYESIHNYYEEGVVAEVVAQSAQFPEFAGNDDLLADVTCVALNALPPRYIRHAIDLSFYMTEKERAKSETALRAAVTHAFEFVRSRMHRHPGS